MKIINDSTFQALDELDMRDVVEELGLHIRKNGSRWEIRCPNPDHNDEHIGNCAVYPDGVHCYACGYHAHPLKVVRDVRHETIWNAAKWLCAMNGIPFEADEEIGPPPAILSEEMLELIDINERQAAQTWCETDRQTFLAFVEQRVDKKIKACQRPHRIQMPEVTKILNERIELLRAFKKAVEKCKTAEKIIIR